MPPKQINRSGKRAQTARQNLIFEKWLKEAMDEAFTKELKSYHSFKKKYPLVFGSGKECRILEGFGPRLCDFLDEKLCKYAEELGMSPSEALRHGNQTQKDAKLPPTKRQQQQLNQLPSTSNSSTYQQTHPLLTAITTVQATTSNGVQKTSKLTFPTLCGPSKKTTAATPAVLTTKQEQLLGLFKSSKNPLGCSLHELAACLRSPGSNHDFMSVSETLNQLVSAGLLHKVPDRPGRFHLVEDVAQPPPSIKESILSPSLSHSVSVQKTNPPLSVSDTNAQIPSSNYILRFRYATALGDPVHLRSDAQCSTFESDDDGPQVSGLRIMCAYENLIVAGVPYRMDWSATSSSSDVYAFLLDPDAPLQSSIPPVKSIDSLPEPPALPPTTLIRVHSSPPASSSSSHAKSLITTTTLAVRILPKTKRSASPTLPAPPIKIGIKRTVSAASAVTSFPLSQSPLPPPTLQCQSHPTSPTQNRSAPINSRLLANPSATLIIPGVSYELILLTDIHEQFGLNRVKQLLPPVLQSFGVQCESRALPVGDFLWIARWTDDTGRPSEAVLDYIVERKRADDLASSIMDGRFQEQKYRMKRTQISNTFFLIEECTAMRNQRIPFETLLQAVANAQVIDGFQVLTTRCPEDTVDLLATMTDTIRKTCTRDLLVSSMETSSIQVKEKQQNQARSWVDFVQLANKSPPPTVHDMFAKQLLQIHGCSSQKVAAILNVYPTPISLMRAYADQSTLQAKHNLLTSLKISGSNRQAFEEYASISLTISLRTLESLNTRRDIKLQRMFIVLRYGLLTDHCITFMLRNKQKPCSV